MPRPTRRLLVAGLVAVLLTAGLVVVGVLALGGDGEPAPTTQPSATPFTTTPLADLDTTTQAVTRGPFCDAVDPRQVSAALGGEPTDDDAWQNGDRATLEPGLADVAHEFGCRWTAADGTSVRAWVFAPPVTTDAAVALSADDRRGACSVTPATFGVSGSLADCPDKSDGTRSLAYRGLFGDAWLSCELSLPAAAAQGDTTALTDRLGRWCAGVLLAEPTS
jgi:hypothetical protein